MSVKLMRKKEVTWLIVRAVGLYFAYCALVSAFAVAAAVPDLFSLPKINTPSKATELKEDASKLIERGEMLPTSDPEKEREKLESERLAAALKVFFLNVGITVLYAFGAWYFIRDGRFVFDALVREEPGKEAVGPDAVTSLNLEMLPSTTVDAAALAETEEPPKPKKKRAPRKKKAEEPSTAAPETTLEFPE